MTNLDSGPVSFRPEVVELIADALRHPDTELEFYEIDRWRHESGEPLTAEEVTTVRTATLGELRTALAICMAETDAALARFN